MRDLTLRDATQLAILNHLADTEELLARTACAVSGTDQSAEIWAMPDLGLPHNINRMHGGFFTGALYTWQTSIPFVPVDATINSCGVSVFRLRGGVDSAGQFDRMITKAIERTERESSYVWNWASGNHFITYGQISDTSEDLNGHYAVLHSSASEFKSQHNGLYPIPGNWYYDSISTTIDPDSGRYLRYIRGRMADRFIELSQQLEQFNRIRHRYFAELVFGTSLIDVEISNEQHYGMPSWNSVAIGCQWLRRPDFFVLLTAPERPLYFVEALPGGSNQAMLDGSCLILQPHGLGKNAVGDLNIEYRPKSLVLNGKEFGLEESLKNDRQFKTRSFSIEEGQGAELPGLVSAVLTACPGRTIARLQPIFSYYRKVA